MSEFTDQQAYIMSERRADVQRNTVWALALVLALVIVFFGGHSCDKASVPANLARIEAYKACVEVTQSPERCHGQNGIAQ